MGHMKSEIRQAQVDWRRQTILQLASDGYSNREISVRLKIPHSTVDRDIIVLRREAKEQISKYITDQVPFEYKETLAGLESIIKYTSSIISDDNNKETKGKTPGCFNKDPSLRYEDGTCI